MSHSRRRRRIPGTTSASARNRRLRRRATCRPFAETLEQRLLLTLVTGVDPAANSHNAPLSAEVVATFDQDINATTANEQTLAVHSMKHGQLVGAAATVSTAGPVVTLDPTANFFPGERVEVTATSAIQSTTADPVTPRVWQFRAEVTSGSAQFVDSGQDFPSPFRGQSVAFGDLDGDGDLDVLHGGDLVWLNDGSGVFTNTGQSLLSSGQGDISGYSDLADLDGDGDLDVVGTARVLLNNGSGVFTDTGQNPFGTFALEVGDLDGDGDFDVMTGEEYAGNRVWFNNGSGMFTSSGQSLGTSNTRSIEFGDLDGDGDLDAWVPNWGAPNRIWMNDGSGVFSDSGQTLGGFSTSRDVDLGDVDGDGDLDAVVANTTAGSVPTTRVWVNDGSGLFTDSGQGMNPGGTWAVKLGDLDGDGDLDLFLPYFYSTANSTVWLNDGAGNFSDTGQLMFPGERWGTSVDLADIDGDGDLDAWATNRFPGGNKLWINQNLSPSVTLSVDSQTITENPGTAIITASLSAAHTQPVTLELGVSGTATPTEDYTISGTQILIPTGSTTGSVSITAVQDTVDDDDETVIVDIIGATNAQEAGTQQVTVTIIDDDEPVPVPEVSLTIDNPTIPEAAGVAMFTANLSVATTVPVTVELSISGSAAATDFNSSATQIVVPPGSTTGSITVTAVQDEVDEPDETVVVDIIGVTGGTELGTQQQVTTILDDDEPVMPDVTLAVDNPTIPEAAGVATFTITLSEATTAPVTVDLGITGTAGATDFTVSATQLVIAVGATTAAVQVSAIQDEVDEPDETVIVDIASVVGGNEVGDQQQTATILDDDIPPSFTVTSLNPNPSGFRVEFAAAVDASDINMYDTQNAGLGAADVVVTGATFGSVSGSLVTDGASVTFIKTGAPLSPDSYTVTLRSAADGFKDTGGMLLDGNADGSAGDNYVGNFTIDEEAALNRSIHIPDFVRGPGQDVNVPADSATGIPVTISDGNNVRAVDLRISYDPALLEITGASAPAGGTVVLNNSTPGLAILVYFNTAPLPAGESTFISLQATVPAESASAIYASQQVLDLHDAVVGDGNDNEFPAVLDDAAHFVAYFADVSGNGRINASDAAQVARFAALIDTGFAASLNTDPVVVGDISGNGRINAADASRVAQFAALIPVPEIPPIPAGVVITGMVAVDLGSGLPEEAASRAVVGRGGADDESARRADSMSSHWGLPPAADWGSAVEVSHDLVMATQDNDEQLHQALEDAIEELLVAGLPSE